MVHDQRLRGTNARVIWLQGLRLSFAMKPWGHVAWYEATPDQMSKNQHQKWRRAMARYREQMEHPHAETQARWLHQQVQSLGSTVAPRWWAFGDDSLAAIAMQTEGMAATADAGTQTDIVACAYDWDVLEVANASAEMYEARGLSRPSEGQQRLPGAWRQIRKDEFRHGQRIRAGAAY